MDKGIRPFCNAEFLQQLPARVNTREGNTAFRKSIIARCMEEFDITLASAATHYNHAFINARELAKTDAVIATRLEGLGRPEDKKGGRKPKPKAEAAPVVPSVIPTPANVVLANMLAVLPKPAAAVEDTPQGDETPAEEAAPVVIKYSVRKVSDGTVVCSELTLDEANALIAKAAAAKKAKLELVA